MMYDQHGYVQSREGLEREILEKNKIIRELDAEIANLRAVNERAEGTAKKLIAEQRLNHLAARILSAVSGLVKHYPSIPGMAGWLEEADRFLLEAGVREKHSPDCHPVTPAETGKERDNAVIPIAWEKMSNEEIVGLIDRAPDCQPVTPGETTGTDRDIAVIPIAWERMSNEEIVGLIDRADREIGERLCPHCHKPLYCWLNTVNCRRCGKVVCIDAECSPPIGGDINGTGEVQNYCPECHEVVIEEIAARVVAGAAGRVVEKAEKGAAELAASAEWDAEITAQAEIEEAIEARKKEEARE